MSWLIEKIQVNIPFTMLYDSWLEVFVKNRLNPEIGLDAAALDRFSLADFGAIADELHKQNLTITLHAPFMDLSPGSPDPKVKETTRGRFEQVLEVVPLFKPKTVVCHAGYDEKRHGYVRDIWLENSMGIWSWLGGRLRREGSLLMLENVYEHGPEDIRPFFETLGNQEAGFCLDTGHQAVFSRNSLSTWVDALGPFIGQLHIHDNSGRKDEHLPPGRGAIDFGDFFKRVAAIKKGPPVITLEPHREEDLRPGLECLEKIWPW